MLTLSSWKISLQLQDEALRQIRTIGPNRVKDSWWSNWNRMIFLIMKKTKARQDDRNLIVSIRSCDRTVLLISGQLTFICRLRSLIMDECWPSFSTRDVIVTLSRQTFCKGRKWSVLADNEYTCVNVSLKYYWRKQIISGTSRKWLSPRLIDDRCVSMCAIPAIEWRKCKRHLQISLYSSILRQSHLNHWSFSTDRTSHLIDNKDERDQWNQSL